jgi:adenine-specific DNA-methyltransferase
MKGLNLLDVCLDAEGVTIPGKTTLMITSSTVETLKFIAAILNSSVAFFYLKEKYPASSYNQGTTFTKGMINDLPIPHVKPSERAKLLSCVENILTARQRDVEADASAMERELDQLVYALYGLTAAERAIVEAATAD